jgi:hypothetical protein
LLLAPIGNRQVPPKPASRSYRNMPTGDGEASASTHSLCTLAGRFDRAIGASYMLVSRKSIRGDMGRASVRARRSAPFFQIHKL